MKYLLLIGFLSLTIFSCRKDQPPGNSDYLETAKKALGDSLRSTDFTALDFEKAARLRVDSIGFFALRVPFKDKVPRTDFVIVKTDAWGHILNGKIVHLEGKASDEVKGEVRRKRWDGQVLLSSLDRKDAFQSPVVNGYITGYHQGWTYRAATEVVEGLMPEIIITYTRTSYGLSWSDMYMIQSLFGSGGGIASGYYTPFSGGGSGGAGDPWSGGGSAGSGSSDPVFLIDMETQDEDQPIDLEKFLNCFNAIPDADAICSIEIFADIPVDTDPDKMFNLGSQSPGHTFLNIRKSNGSQSVSQNIGFYPKYGWKTLLSYGPVEGKFVDNGQHEFNCGYKINVSPQQLKAALVQMIQSKDVEYDIDDFNCTDWALNVFNSAGGDLQVPFYNIPLDPSPGGTRMPNGVYKKLQELKALGGPNAANIQIGFLKGYAGNSTGPCN
ncbi:hypothetical protein [Flavisolibacter nicotianae]|uniref:hypothetical protein n=1 Tax=Flavisolibacter nicotianae TaxID=2364882 RepID=UPI000EB185F2|nr:hypothetical protein [Flavisolibacter nicotianae]